MIRFVDLRAADISGVRFTFWDTVYDRFDVANGCQGWETWDEYIESQTEPFDPAAMERRKGLCPKWVFEPTPDDEDGWGKFQVVRRDEE